MSVDSGHTTQRTKLPIRGTVTRAYGFVFDHLRDFAALAAIPFVVGIAGEVPVLFFSGETEGSPVILALMFFIMILTAFIPWLVFIVAWHRFVLFGKRETHKLVEFHIGRRELRFFAYGLLLAIYLAASISAIFFLQVQLGVPGQLDITWKSGFSISSTDLLVVLLSVRFLFLFPAIAVGDDTGVVTAWKQSGGVAWRLFWVLILAALLFDILNHLLESFGAAESEITGVETQDYEMVRYLVLTIIQGLVLFLGSAVSVVALARSYQHVVGERYQHVVGESGRGEARIPEIKNEPLRLVLSVGERAYIHERLRSAIRRLVVWLMVSALSASAILGGATQYGVVPKEVRVDRAISEIENGISDSIGAAECQGTYYVYSGTRRTIKFCDNDPQLTKFRAHLEAVVEEQGWWPVVNLLLIGVGILALLLSLIGVVGALFGFWKYRKYRGDLRAILRRYNRAE
jgi:hypothetical protein